MSALISNYAQGLKTGSASPWTAFLRRVFQAPLRRLRAGAFELSESGRAPVVVGDPEGGVIPVTIHSPEFYDYAVFGGNVGLGEGYMLGLWTSPDPVGVCRLMFRNVDQFDGFESGLAWLRWPLLKLFEWRHRNGPDRSRLNIAAHYDLGNDFFRTFLDPTMTYSAAIFRTGSESLEQAQVEKLDAICRKLELEPGEHVIEIGSGWGSFAIHAASNYGVRVTTTTLSREQHKLATERVRSAGLEDRVTVLLQDYRELQGTYHKLVSVEMIEAVGHEHHAEYFKVVERLLKPGGQALIQAITCPDDRYDAYRRSNDFIRRYIFPGGLLPSMRRMLTVATAQTSLQLFHMEDFCADYAATIAAWRASFWQQQAAVRALGYGETFERMWDFYLAVCQAGFAERFNAVVQLLFTTPRCIRGPVQA